MHDPELNPGKDLTDPKQLIQELKVIADGMGQQAAATSTGTALGGHSNPAWLYTHCADVARAAEVMITKLTQPTITAVADPGGVAVVSVEGPRTMQAKEVPPDPSAKPGKK